MPRLCKVGKADRADPMLQDVGDRDETALLAEYTGHGLEGRVAPLKAEHCSQPVVAAGDVEDLGEVVVALLADVEGGVDDVRGVVEVEGRGTNVFILLAC